MKWGTQYFALTIVGSSNTYFAVLDGQNGEEPSEMENEGNDFRLVGFGWMTSLNWQSQSGSVYAEKTWIAVC